MAKRKYTAAERAAMGKPSPKKKPRPKKIEKPYRFGYIYADEDDGMERRGRPTTNKPDQDTSDLEWIGAAAVVFILIIIATAL